MHSLVPLQANNVKERESSKQLSSLSLILHEYTKGSSLSLYTACPQQAEQATTSLALHQLNTKGLSRFLDQEMLRRLRIFLY